jgi:hypothetical protein
MSRHDLYPVLVFLIRPEILTCSWGDKREAGRLFTQVNAQWSEEWRQRGGFMSYTAIIFILHSLYIYYILNP